MRPFARVYPLLLLLSLLGNCQDPPPSIPKAIASTGPRIGGGCDGCEAMYVGMPGNISSIDTSAGFSGPGQQLLVKGTVFNRDGKTPAPGVILYYWHTDHTGVYPPDREGKESTRHGKLRGWLRSGSDGSYALYTVRPAPYPAASEPAHIHFLIREPGLPNEYYIDDLLFDDDTLLTSSRRQALQQRGGNGILTVQRDGPLQVAIHDVVLGLNIPGYPDSPKQ